MSCEKIKRIKRIELMANFPNNRHKDTLKCYKAEHNNGYELSLIIIVVVGVIIDVEEGK